jgi:hypothetical protein
MTTNDFFNETMRDELGDHNWFDLSIDDGKWALAAYERGADIESLAAALRARLCQYDKQQAVA